MLRRLNSGRKAVVKHRTSIRERRQQTEEEICENFYPHLSLCRALSRDTGRVPFPGLSFSGTSIFSLTSSSLNSQGSLNIQRIGFHKLRSYIRSFSSLTPDPPPSTRADSGDQSSRSVLQDKLREYATLSPVPISIAQFLERGGRGKISEEDSYAHLVEEVLVRLAHLISELQHLPQELKEEEDYKYLVEDYILTFSQIIKFENTVPDTETLRKWTEVLKTSKERHRDVVPKMAAACMKMKNKFGINLEGEECALTRTVQYVLDRLYMSRISLNMLTNQHLIIYGHKSTIENQIGVIHPNTDIESVVLHAYQNALYLCEQCYLAGPGIEVKSQNTTCPDTKVTLTQVPSHIYHIVFEILKNAMQATMLKHEKDEESVIPPIKVLICQSDRDITIRVSDLGGGIDRNAQEKMFKYLYTTSPRASITGETVPLSGLGYGLPLARLYARYFQGDVRAASYEGYGTDVYIYLNALAGEAVEMLPVWSPTASDKMRARSSPVSDWTGKSSRIR